MTTIDPRTPLIKGISQYDVDFVIPRLGVDIPVGIDPFLLYKSRDPEYRKMHSQLLDAFHLGIAAVRQNKRGEARRIFDFPEVSAIGMGYTVGGKRGSGVGTYLAGLIVDTVVGSPNLQERGIRHIEEMQLLSAGIGADRVSDIAANILKSFLIEYTQRQCAIWSIPLKSGVPVEHIYDAVNREWIDSYTDLPVSPVDGAPILLVPRRIVRTLPWINYDDFFRTEFKAYLAAKRQAYRQSSPASNATENTPTSKSKPQVVTVTRSDLTVVERYVKARERQAADARPALDYMDGDVCKEVEVLKAKLAAIRPGREEAGAYQKLVLEILNFLFNPELIDGTPEVRTIDGTERRDIIFTNDSDESFWDYVRTSHDGVIVMFETKNMDELGMPEINQTATYLGDRIGRMGIIVTRRPPGENIVRKIFSVWNDSASARKIILTLCDGELRELLDLRCKGGSPSKWMQSHYRTFRTSVQ
jgi:hypothetical protein